MKKIKTFLRRRIRVFRSAYRHHRQPCPGLWMPRAYALEHAAIDALAAWPRLSRALLGGDAAFPVPGRWYRPTSEDPAGTVARRWA